MSNIYLTEPNTEGKVVFHTSFGDLDVELWPNEAPKAVRNFIQLALEHYYDNTIFHRVISKFMVQGGDPTGTGTGGSSIYNGPFSNEIHSRLKFNHRGLLAMANENKPKSNHSQFFFTLDSCEFLNKKHTIFGKITGNTIFNLLPLSDLETDSSDRPLEPPVLRTIEVLWNPFDDIVPRVTEASTTSAAADITKPAKKKRKKVKNINLLSFEAEDDDTTPQSIKSSHDVLPSLSSAVDDKIQKRVTTAATKTTLEKKSDTKSFEEKMKEKIRAIKAAKEASCVTLVTNETVEKKTESKTLAADEYLDLQRQLKSTYSALPGVITGKKKEEMEAQKAFVEMQTPLQQRRQKYLMQKKTFGDRQKKTLESLEAFKTSIQKAKSSSDDNNTSKTKEQESYHGQVLVNEEDDEDDDDSWKSAKLKFKKHIDDQYKQGFAPSADDYVTIDTRNT